MNIYTTPPQMVETRKTFGEYVTAIHMDIRELTAEEFATAFPDGLQSALADSPGENAAVSEASPSEQQTAWTATDYFLYHSTPKPDIEKVRQTIEDHINAKVDANILCGYPWTVLHGPDAGKDVKVWLSEENQNNFKAKHDAALIYPDKVKFPMTYKISEVNHKAVYEVFQSIEELATFYLGGLAYIESCYNAGWSEKDAVDYDALFEEDEE